MFVTIYIEFTIYMEIIYNLHGIASNSTREFNDYKKCVIYQ